jgi:hypothetical protein
MNGMRFVADLKTCVISSCSAFLYDGKQSYLCGPALRFVSEIFRSGTRAMLG